MEELLDFVSENFNRLDARSVIDILLIAAIIYLILLLIRGTTAMAVLRGAAIILIGAFALGRLLDLQVLNFLLRNSLVGLFIAVPIVFQPELRRALARLGRTGGRTWLMRPDYENVISAVSEAAINLSQRRHGALLVLERETGLEDYIDTGVRVDASPSAQLLEGLFFPNSPLHDGAVILRENRVVAAACTLPLSDDTRQSQMMGTRHRAALGITERTDAISVVVSEETGHICVASNGRMLHRLDDARLRATLEQILGRVVDGAQQG